MKRLSNYLRRLKHDEEELLMLLELNREQQKSVEAIINSRKVEVKLEKPLVSEKLGTEMRTTHGGKITVAQFILDAFTALGEPLDINTILDYVNEKRPDTPLASVTYALNAGLKKGLFKRINPDGKVMWTINVVKEQPKASSKKAPHVRPNYGIERAVANEVNKLEKGTLISPEFLLIRLQDDFPDATEMTIKSVLSRWFANKRPGMDKKSFGDHVSYTFKQPIKI